MNNLDWLERLQMLLVRILRLGVDADIAALDLMALWGLYLFLSQLADG